VEHHSLCSFKVDTRTEVIALSEKTYNLFWFSAKAPEIYSHTNRTPLDILGEAQMKLSYNAKSSTQQVFVVRDLQHDLLGLPAIRDLEVITGIYVIEFSIPDQLFAGLHLQGRVYHQTQAWRAAFLSKKCVDSPLG